MYNQSDRRRRATVGSCVFLLICLPLPQDNFLNHCTFACVCLCAQIRLRVSMCIFRQEAQKIKGFSQLASTEVRLAASD